MSQFEDNHKNACHSELRRSSWVSRASDQEKQIVDPARKRAGTSLDFC